MRATLASGGTTSAEATEAMTETLIRYANQVLDTTGVNRSPSWVSRTVRSFQQHASGRMRFGTWLVNRLQLNTEQRIALRSNPDIAYLMTYVDPTGETAVRNVMRSAG